VENIQLLKAELRLLYQTHEADTPMVRQVEDRVRAAQRGKRQDCRSCCGGTWRPSWIVSDNVALRASRWTRSRVTERSGRAQDMAAEQSEYEAMAVRASTWRPSAAELQLINEVNLMKARAEAAGAHGSAGRASCPSRRRSSRWDLV
jgi:hypothetical protein